MHTTFLPELALGCLLLFACLFDLRQRRIPNRLLAIGLLAALVLQLGSGPPSALLTSYLAGFALGLLMFLPLYLLGGMAAGDVKLMATVGAFVGPALVFQSSLATYCFGGVMALAIVLAKGRARRVRQCARAAAAGRHAFWRRAPGAASGAGQCRRHAIRPCHCGRNADSDGPAPHMSLRLGIACFGSKAARHA